MQESQPSRQPLRIHPLLWDAVALGLLRIFFRDQYAEQVVADMISQHGKWGSRDRNFFASSVYGIVRNWRLLWYLNDMAPVQDKQALERLIAIYWVREGFELPDTGKFAGIDSHTLHEKILGLKDNPAILHSIPDWLYTKGLAETGPRWEQILHAWDETAPVFIHVNRLKISKTTLREKLGSLGWTVTEIPGRDEALEVNRKGNLTRTREWMDGGFEIMDANSQLIAPFLEVAPDMTVVDACAGAGGKTLHMASLMQNRGQIFAMDTGKKKLEELRRRAERAGCGIVSTSLPDSRMISVLNEKADRVLLDVPCSGTGVIRRTPDTKWKLTAEKLAELYASQQRILHEYCGMVKPGGKLVYATCSILPSENEAQTQAFLRDNTDFVLEDMQTVLPGDHGGDGFFMARMIRK